MLSNLTNRTGIKGFYKKAIAVIKNHHQFVKPEEQYNVIMMFGDLFPDLKEEDKREKR